MSTKDGGPAFPQSVSGHDGPTASYDFVDGAGMSLRDYFAAQALAGIFASRHLSETVTDVALATEAYEVADAMLKAREQS